MKELAKASLRHSFTRYVLIGLCAFAVEYGSFYVLYRHYDMWVWLANALSFGLGLLLAFVLNRLWAFSHHEYNKRAIMQLGMYTGLALFNLFLTLVIVATLKWLGVQPLIGKLIAMVVTSSWNFLFLKLWVFTHVVNEG